MRNKLIIILSTIILIALCAGGYMWWKKSNGYETLKTFSCPGVNNFTFDYPVFEDWEDIKIEKSASGCRVEFGWSGFTEVPPMSPTNTVFKPFSNTLYITVEKSSSSKENEETLDDTGLKEASRIGGMKKNKNNIRYETINDGTIITKFYNTTDNTVVTVEIMDVKWDEYLKFSSKTVNDMIIKTFKFIT